MIKNKKFKIRYLTDNQGKKKDVVLSLKDFEELLEDIEDLAVLAERKRGENDFSRKRIKEIKIEWTYIKSSGKSPHKKNFFKLIRS